MFSLRFATCQGWPFTRALRIVAVFLLSAACSEQGSFESALSGHSESESSSWQSSEDRNFWIAKVARTLRVGEGVSASEVRELAKLSDEEIVKTLMSQPEFADTALDFALFYLRYKSEPLFYEDGDGRRSYGFFSVRLKPAAITAAQAIFHERNFFDFYNEDQPLWVSASELPRSESGEEPASRERALTKFREKLEIIRALLSRPDSSKEESCGSETLGDRSVSDWINEFSDGIGALGLGIPLGMGTKFGILLNINCNDKTKTASDVLKLFEEMGRVGEHLYTTTVKFDTTTYSPRNISEFLSAENALNSELLTSKQFETFGFWLQHPNSSTNLNRKRAAYVLDTFFCDDLTPLSIVASANEHGEGQHGSDPSCRSCHYKLDPMAGFFRDIGLLGVNFKEANTSFHVFDDNAFVAGEDLTKYYGTWSKTGFIRSSLDDGVNDLIATEDVNRVQKMFEIVRRAPEAKSCLTRRLAEYVLGEDQSFDGRWLKSFESRLEDSSTSGLAIKSVLSDLVLSNTFKVADPASDQCYDYLTEQSEGESIPCEVSFIVEKNCAASCHKSASSDNGQLSLSEWVPAAIDGTDSTNPLVRSFKHLDENGAQRSKKDTFTSILDRINSSDPDRAMPLAKEMPSVEKVRLFNWLEDEMER